jgi:hypothetical protein
MDASIIARYEEYNSLAVNSIQKPIPREGAGWSLLRSQRAYANSPQISARSTAHTERITGPTTTDVPLVDNATRLHAPTIPAYVDRASVDITVEKCLNAPKMIMSGHTNTATASQTEPTLNVHSNSLPSR